MKLIFFLKNLSMFKSSQTLHSCSSETVRHIENGPRARECTLQPSLTKLFSYFNPYLSFGPKFGKIWWSWFFFSKICLCSKAHRLYTALRQWQWDTLRMGPELGGAPYNQVLLSFFPSLTHTFHLVQSLGRSDEVDFFLSKICLCPKAHRLCTALACDHS